jgi:hypothetical protein
MIRPPKIIAFCVPAILLLILNAPADVRISIQGCNNRYGSQWVMTPSPEVALTWKWFGLGLDGSLAAYTPSGALQNYTLATRVSFYPLLRIPLGRFFLESGYGIAQRFMRDEILNAGGSYDFKSSQTIHGEIRAAAGWNIPLNGSSSVILRGGLGHQETNNRFFFASLGIGFGAHPDSKSGVSASVRLDEVQALAESRTAARVTLSVLGGEDAISAEFRASIEAALIEKGYQVTSWDRIRNAVQDDFLKQARAGNPKATIEPSLMDSLTSLQIALLGSRLLSFDAIVETSIRYFYKAYGEDIVVQSASLRLTRADSGSILWVTEYDSPDTSFPGCKRQMIKELVSALRRFADRDDPGKNK